MLIFIFELETILMIKKYTLTERQVNVHNRLNSSLLF